MISRSSLVHIRIPFSYFLMPVFFLALFCAGCLDPAKTLIVFFVLHFLLYPASNGFNSFFDRDTESIGAVKLPPRVTGDLLWLSLALDAAAVAVALAVSPLFATGCFLYGCASKAYSWDKIRIKKYPVFGWLYIGVCQGLLTFLLVLLCVGDTRAKDILSFRILFPSIACCLFILGFYPLTQVYQHRVDAKRHDFTISMLWGVRGTFYCTAPLLLASGAAFFRFFTMFFGIRLALFFLLMLIPAGAYFVAWFVAVARDGTKADFSHAMRMNILASSGVNVFAVVSLFLIKIG